MNRNNNELSSMRANYKKGTLSDAIVDQDPYTLFDKWMADARSAGIIEPNAMVLSTVSDVGVPSSRVVLLKDIIDGDFVFYTNYNSSKATDIESNPNVCLNFLWKQVERQVRISGKATKTSRDITEAYFSTRPRGSKIGAWVSPQSEVIENRDVLEQLKEKYTRQYEISEDIPAPKHWGGYRVHVSTIEFWQGRESRLHDRIRFRKDGNAWIRERLAP